MTGDAVRRQYETFPYPPRGPGADDPAASGSPSHVLEVDHFLYGGRRDWSRPFRALVAGGGTGNATVMLARQLAEIGCPAEVVQLDLSAASRTVAEERVRAAGLDAVDFVTGCLLDIAQLAPGPFDYIDCCGVLHHLDDPDAGLAALGSVLAPDGGMGVMLYGALGRTGVYDIQDAMRTLARPGEDQATLLPALRALLDQLPDSNRLARNRAIAHDPGLPDAELVDLFLHPRDRAYTVADIGAMAAGAGLAVAAFVPPGRYDPATYLNDDELLGRLDRLAPLARAGLAERLAGNIAKHVFYLVPAERGDTAARPRTPDAVPMFKTGSGAALAARLDDGSAFIARLDDLTLTVAPTPLSRPILQAIDGKRSLGDIYFSLSRTTPGLSWPAFLAEYQVIHGVFHGLLNALFLRYPR